MVNASESTLDKLQKDLKNHTGVLYDSLGVNKQVFFTLQLLKRDILFCDLQKDYSYLLGAIPHLYDALAFDNKIQEEVYHYLQMIRVDIKNLLFQKKQFKENNYDNYKFFLKLLGKIEVFSLTLAKTFDERYDESKSELLHYLIFSIKNLNVLKDVVEKKSHQFNPLDERSILLIEKVIVAYLKALDVHVMDLSFKNLDELIYFNDVLKILLNSMKSRLTVKEVKFFDSFFEISLDNMIENKRLNREAFKRYSYFIEKWREDFFDYINSSSKNISYPSFGNVSLEEVFYIYKVDFDFDILVQREANYIYNQYIARKEKISTNREIFTIDGSVSSDIMEIDDGFSCTMENGIYRLGIHISNPCGYAGFHHLIFEEALKRTTSVYMREEGFEKTLSMFDKKIASDLFSLKEHSVRKAISFYIDIDLVNKEIIGIDYQFENVNVYKNYTYKDSNRMIHTQKGDEKYLRTINLIQELYPFLNSFYHTDPLYQKLNRREENVSSTNIIGSTRSEKIVECLMIFTNYMMSGYALKEGIPFLYRNHKLSTSFEEDLKYFKDILLKDKNSSFYLNEINILESLYDKSRYDTECIGHEGIGLPHYTHVTSPIRRAADLLNIEMLLKYKKGISDKEMYLSELRLREFAEYINEQNSSLQHFVRDYHLQRKM